MTTKTLLKRVMPTHWQPAAVAQRMRQHWEQCPSVRAGPFAGMKFTWADWNPDYSAPFSKCMGTYELELHPIIEEIIALAPKRIVEVGAAEGYYAVGYARRLPATEIILFEELKQGRQLLLNIAAANGVAARMTLHGRCERADLARVVSEGTVLMLDVEGYEGALLDPVTVPALQRATILVECHDQYVPGVTEKVRARFAPTHVIRDIENRRRNAADLPHVPLWFKAYCRHQFLGWANERVGTPMKWLFMRPKTA